MRRGIAPYYNLGILAKSNIILYIQIRNERYISSTLIILGLVYSNTRSYYRKESAASPPRDQRQGSIRNLLNKGCLYGCFILINTYFLEMDYS